jgi:hypothetical protein
MRRLYIAPTGRTGQGLFTKVSFKAGETVVVLRGKVRTDAYDSRWAIGPRWIGIGDNRWIDPPFGSYAHFLNHSCDANCVVNQKRLVVSIRPIAAGEQITIDYSTTEIDPYWKMPCKCGAAKCRRVIRAVQKLPVEIYDKFQPYLSPKISIARS